MNTETIILKVNDSRIEAKLREYLETYWADFVTTFSVQKNSSGSVDFSVSGDPVGLSVVLQNIKKAKWDITVESPLANESVARKRSSKTEKPRNSLVIHIPVIEEDWEDGLVKFPSKLTTKSKTSDLKQFLSKTLPGWRVTYSKCSIGIVIDLTKSASLSNLQKDLATGWDSWQVCFDHAKSNFYFNSIIEPEDSNPSYTELLLMSGGQEFRNLEEQFGITFIPKQQPKLLRPPDSVLYSMSETGEDPFRIVHETKEEQKIIYDSSKKKLDRSTLKTLILSYLV